MSILLTNNASSLLAAPVLATDLTLTITLADAPGFPQPTLAGDYFYMVIEDQRVVPNVREIIKCTARSANVLTITRGAEGTTPSAFYSGAVVSVRITAATLFAIRAEEAARATAAEAAEIVARNAAILVETTRAEAAEAAEVTARQTAIFNEQNTRSAADTALATAITTATTTEIAARNAAIAAAIANLATVSSVAAVLSQLTAAETTYNSEIASLNAALSAETARAEIAEAASGFPAGYRLEVGASATASSGYASVSFASAFSAAPLVVAGEGGGPSGSYVAAYNFTTTGFTVYSAKSSTTGAGLGPVAFTWIAVGPR